VGSTVKGYRLPAELTASAVGKVGCASRRGGAMTKEGTSVGEHLSSDAVGHEHLAAPAVAGSIQRATSSPRISCEDLIKSLACGHLEWH